MASVYLHPKSKYWYACYSTRDGKQAKVSTKETDKAKAKLIAIELERAELLARSGHLTKTQLQKVVSDLSTLR